MYPQIIDVKEALKLRLTKGYTYQEIADKYGVTKQAVHKQLKSLVNILEDTNQAQAYKLHKQDILTNAEYLMLVDMCDPDKREKASLNNAAYAFNTIFQANRLESDKSTSNLAIDGILAQKAEAQQNLQDLQDREAVLLAELERRKALKQSNTGEK